jgi:hypothetical protein
MTLLRRSSEEGCSKGNQRDGFFWGPAAALKLGLHLERTTRTLARGDLTSLVEEMRAGSCQSLSQRLHQRAGALGWLQGGFRVASGHGRAPSHRPGGFLSDGRPAVEWMRRCHGRWGEMCEAVSGCERRAGLAGGRVDVRVCGWHWHWRCQHRHPSLDGAWTGECTSR